MKANLGWIAALLALGIVACGGSSNSPTAPADLTPFQVESESAGLVNQARSDGNEAPPLGLDPLLAQVAREHSEAMRDDGFFSHVDPSGKRLRDRLRAAGIQFRSAGENLAQVDGSSDPAGEAHRRLMGSASHRDNILSGRFEQLGVGVAKRGDTFWITQVFVEP